MFDKPNKIKGLTIALVLMEILILVWNILNLTVFTNIDIAYRFQNFDYWWSDLTTILRRLFAIAILIGAYRYETKSTTPYGIKGGLLVILYAMGILVVRGGQSLFRLVQEIHRGGLGWHMLLHGGLPVIGLASIVGIVWIIMRKRAAITLVKVLIVVTTLYQIIMATYPISLRHNISMRSKQSIYCKWLLPRSSVSRTIS